MPHPRKPERKIHDAKHIAAAYRNLFGELTKAGFTAEQALEIVSLGDWEEMVKNFEPVVPPAPTVTAPAPAPSV